MAKLVVIEDGDEREKWFPFDEDTEIQIRYLGFKDLKKLNDKANKVKRMEGRARTDFFNCLLGRKVILGWRKIDDHAHPGLIVKGNPFPYTQENIDYLMSNSSTFSKFINDYCTDAEAFDIEAEEAAKNE